MSSDRHLRAQRTGQGRRLAWRRWAALARGALVAGGLSLAAASAGASVALPMQVPAAQVPQEAWDFTGEQGLSVRIEGRNVVVRWITAEEGRGFVDAFAGDQRIGNARTRAGIAHRASFRHRGADEVILRYGSLTDPSDRHETLVRLAEPQRPPVSVTGVDSLYVLGDTHGEYELLVRGLQAAGLLDDRLHWSGGRLHVAFAGDLVDRGPDVHALLWLVYRLEREAEAAGGAVHVVLGNHEIMVMLGDERYVHPKEIALAAAHGVSYAELFDVRRSILGRWLASRPALIRVDRVLIAHGGLGPMFADYGLVEFDDSLAAFVGEELFERWADTSWVVPMDSATYQRRDDFFWHDDSVFWHRGYVRSEAETAVLERVLDSMDSDLLVVGHTAVDGLAAGHDGRLVAAHTPRFGEELLLLVRTGDGYRRYRINPESTSAF